MPDQIDLDHPAKSPVIQTLLETNSLRRHRPRAGEPDGNSAISGRHLKTHGGTLPFLEFRFQSFPSNQL